MMAQHWTEAPLVGFEGLAEPRVIDGAMAASDARACIDRVKDHWQAFWFELKAFHDGEGWLALGYTSFKRCVESELGFSERRAYQLLEAAEIRAELAAALDDGTEHVFSTERMTEAHARVLAPLPPPARIEIARRTDFRETSAPQLRETVDRAKAALARVDAETPDWDAITTVVESDPHVLDARLRHAFSRAIDQARHGVLDIDPSPVMELLDDADRQDTAMFVHQLREWCDQAEAALATVSTLRRVR